MKIFYNGQEVFFIEGGRKRFGVISGYLNHGKFRFIRLFRATKDGTDSFHMGTSYHLIEPV